MGKAYSQTPQYWRDRYAANPEKYRKANKRSYTKHRTRVIARVKANTFKMKYGITIEEYEAAVERQNGECAICFKGQTRLFVDHDHESGRVRELLCSNCNFGLGHFKDDTVRLHRAILYLRKHSSQLVGDTVRKAA